MRPHRQESVPEISDLFKSVPKTDHRLPLIDSAERNSVRGRTPSLTAAKVSKVAEMVDFIDCSRYLPSTRCCIDRRIPFYRDETIRGVYRFNMKDIRTTAYDLERTIDAKVGYFERNLIFLCVGGAVGERREI